MPWSADDAIKHTKSADTPKKRSTWAKVANEALARGDGDASAIREANAVIGRMAGQGGYVVSWTEPNGAVETKTFPDRASAEALANEKRVQRHTNVSIKEPVQMTERTPIRPEPKMATSSKHDEDFSCEGCGRPGTPETAFYDSTTGRVLCEGCARAARADRGQGWKGKLPQDGFSSETDLPRVLRAAPKVQGQAKFDLGSTAAGWDELDIAGRRALLRKAGLPKFQYERMYSDQLSESVLRKLDRAATMAVPGSVTAAPALAPGIDERKPLRAAPYRSPNPDPYDAGRTGADVGLCWSCDEPLIRGKVYRYDSGGEGRVPVCPKCWEKLSGSNERVPLREAPKMNAGRAAYEVSHSLDPHQDGGDDGW